MITILESPDTLKGVYISTESLADVTYKLPLHMFKEVGRIDVANEVRANEILANFHTLPDTKVKSSMHPIYDVSAVDAMTLLKEMASNDTLNDQQSNTNLSTDNKRKDYRFENIGVPYGAILTGKHTNVELMVVWDNRVLPRGTMYNYPMTLTAATTLFMPKYGLHAKRYWCYNGVPLYDIARTQRA